MIFIHGNYCFTLVTECAGAAGVWAPARSDARAGLAEGLAGRQSKEICGADA